MFPGFFVIAALMFFLFRSFGRAHRYAFYAPYGRGMGYLPRRSRFHDAWDDPHAFGWEAGEWPWASFSDWGLGDRRRWSAGARRQERGSTVSSRGASGFSGSDFEPTVLDAALQRFLGSLRGRLNTTSAQDRALDAAALRLRDAARELTDRSSEMRDHLARALTSETFDEIAFDAAYQRVDEGMQQLRVATRGALSGVHAVLDPNQREILARMVESTRAADA
jgi:hypothetical protein